MRVTLGLCLVLAFASPILAQTSASLRAADKARSVALDEGNAKAWAKYTTDDFQVILADGSVKSKQQRVREIDGHPRTKVTTSEEHWRVYGVTAIETLRSDAADDKPLRITQVWVRDHGTWKTASVQLTWIGATPPAK